jgi:hypothetical protein
VRGRDAPARRRPAGAARCGRPPAGQCVSSIARTAAWLRLCSIDSPRPSTRQGGRLVRSGRRPLACCDPHTPGTEHRCGPGRRRRSRWRSRSRAGCSRANRPWSGRRTRAPWSRRSTRPRRPRWWVRAVGSRRRRTRRRPPWRRLRTSRTATTSGWRPDGTQAPGRPRDLRTVARRRGVRRSRGGPSGPTRRPGRPARASRHAAPPRPVRRSRRRRPSRDTLRAFHGAAARLGRLRRRTATPRGSPPRCRPMHRRRRASPSPTDSPNRPMGDFRAAPNSKGTGRRPPPRSPGGPPHRSGYAPTASAGMQGTHRSACGSRRPLRS